MSYSSPCVLILYPKYSANCLGKPSRLTSPALTPWDISSSSTTRDPNGYVLFQVATRRRDSPAPVFDILSVFNPAQKAAEVGEDFTPNGQEKGTSKDTSGRISDPTPSCVGYLLLDLHHLAGFEVALQRFLNALKFLRTQLLKRARTR